MRDSGLNVVVGLRKGGKSWDRAKKEGHKVMTIPDAVEAADIIHVLVPDMEQVQRLQGVDCATSEEGATPSRSPMGRPIHWKWIVPPKNVDVIMIAPEGAWTARQGTLP